MGITMKYKLDRRRLILFLSFLYLTITINAQTTFDINDPRNPHCPCHKYQKLADEEYAKLIRMKNKGNGEVASRSNLREDKIRKNRVDRYRKQKHKARDKKIRTPRWIYKFKNWAIWKRITDPGKCPIWNDR